MPDSSPGLASPGISLRVEPATIEDLPAVTGLVMELMELQGDFTPDQDAQERGIRLILEEPNRGRIFVLLGSRIDPFMDINRWRRRFNRAASARGRQSANGDS